MSSMSMLPSAVMALATVAMMVAMMLPSIAATAWRYHRRVRAIGLSRAGARTALFAVGYASVWTAIGLALFGASAGLSPVGTPSPMELPSMPWLPGAVVLGAGAVQRSRWKARQLARCGRESETTCGANRSVLWAWRDGWRLGVGCGLSCAAPMSVLFVAGLMDAPTMLVVTTAVAAERLAPAGARIARLTGAVAMIAGLIMCVCAFGALAAAA